jgi:hypothetical protein
LVSVVIATVFHLRIRKHPQYNEFTQDNDFALLKLDEVLDFSQYQNIRPICFPTAEPATGETVTSQKNTIGLKGRDLLTVVGCRSR